MKKIYSILAGILFVFEITAQPMQHIYPENYFYTHTHLFNENGMPIQMQPSNKTEAINSRLIAFNREKWETGAWTEFDSIHFVYSGNRGGDYNTGNIPKPDEQNYFTSSTGIFKESTRYLYNYNVKNDITVFTGLEWLGAWNNKFKYAYQYDARHNEIENLYQLWNTSAWEDNSRSIKTYDANNNNTSSIYMAAIAGVLTNDFKTVWNYNSANQLTSSEKYDWVTGAWVITNRTTNTLDINNNILSTLFEIYSGGTWVNQARYTYTYDSNNNKLTETYEIFSGGVWMNFWRYTFTYDSNNKMLSKTNENYSGAWVNSERQTWQYDVNNSIIQHNYYTWVGGAWQNLYLRVFSYNSYNQYTTTFGSRWVSGTWENEYGEFYYYETYDDASVGINDAKIMSSSVYPNPFSTNVAIDFSTEKSDVINISITDMNGRLVYTVKRYYPAGIHSIIWQPNDAVAGMYIYHITGQYGKTTGRIVKQ